MQLMVIFSRFKIYSGVDFISSNISDVGVTHWSAIHALSAISDIFSRSNRVLIKILAHPFLDYLVSFFSEYTHPISRDLDTIYDIFQNSKIVDTSLL